MQWTKTPDATYLLSNQEELLGELRLQHYSNCSLAVGRVRGREIQIRRVGFWKSRVEITDSFGQVLLEMQPQKWHGDAYVVRARGQEYCLRLRNNPLAEYVIGQGEQELLTYGLTLENRLAGVRISHNPDYSGEPLFELDLLLWYLFLPMVEESFGQQPQLMELAS